MSRCSGVTPLLYTLRFILYSVSSIYEQVQWSDPAVIRSELEESTEDNPAGLVKIHENPLCNTLYFMLAGLVQGC